MAPAIVRTTLFSTPLAPAKLAAWIESQRIDFGPGQRSPLHQHPCPVFGTIVSGSCLFEVEGQPARTLKAGDAFYEPAGVRVPHFDNASATEGMRFIAFYLLGSETEGKVEIL